MGLSATSGRPARFGARRPRSLGRGSGGVLASFREYGRYLGHPTKRMGKSENQRRTVAIPSRDGTRYSGQYNRPSHPGEQAVPEQGTLDMRITARHADLASAFAVRAAMIPQAREVASRGMSRQELSSRNAQQAVTSHLAPALTSIRKQMHDRQADGPIHCETSPDCCDPARRPARSSSFSAAAKSSSSIP